jgi:hypothetical protein
MRRWTKALGIACAVAGAVGITRAQFNISPQSADTGVMPGGQVVGSSYVLHPAGNQLPQAAPQAGNAIGNPLTRPYDPSRPLDQFKGTNIDPKNVAAPMSSFPSLQTQNRSFLDKVNERLASVVKFFDPSDPPRPTWTPGISRRNRERAKQRMWRID